MIRPRFPMCRTFARVVAFVAIGFAGVAPAVCAEAENAGAWRLVSRIRGEAKIEYHTWIDETSWTNRTTVDTVETGQVRFVLVREPDPELALPPGLPPAMAAQMRALMPSPEPKSYLFWRAESATITGTYRHRSEDTAPPSKTTGQADFAGEPAYLKDFIFGLTPATGVWQILTPGILVDRYQVTYVRTGDDSNISYGTHNAVQDHTFNGTVKGKVGMISTVQRDSGQVDAKPTRGFTKVSELRLWPEVEDVEVEVTIKDYEKWRPLGSVANPAKPGNHLVARATLVPKEGGPVKVLPKIEKFSFELVGTSREPGVCLNWPLDAKDTIPICGSQRHLVSPRSFRTRTNETKSLELWTI